jgi:hypothetical protein
MFGERPRDVRVTFRIDGRTATLEERGHGFLEPFHIALIKVFDYRMPPGVSTELAVVRSHPAITEAMFLESAGLDSSRRQAG